MTATKPTDLSAYADAAEQWLRAADVDANVRFMGSHYRITWWGCAGARCNAMVLGAHLVAKMKDVIDAGWTGYVPRHIPTFAEIVRRQ